MRADKDVDFALFGRGQDRRLILFLHKTREDLDTKWPFAQAILEQICIPSSIIDVPMDEELPNVGTRGENGFGSTGIAANTNTPQISMTVYETDANNKKQRMDVEDATSISPSASDDVAGNNDNTMNNDK